MTAVDSHTEIRAVRGRVCMFVYNNCASDPRVFKEAATLRKAGWDVQVVGVLDRQTLPGEERDGIRIVRIDRQPAHYRLLRGVRSTRAWVRRSPQRARRSWSSAKARVRHSRARWRAARRAGIGRLRRRRSQVHPLARRWPRPTMVLAAGFVVPIRLWRAARWRAVRLVRWARGLLGRVSRRGSSDQRATLPPARPGPIARAAALVRKSGGTIDRSLSRGAYRTVMVFHKPLLYLDWYLRTYRLVRGQRFHVLHAHDLNTLPVAALLARRSGARLVYDAHELYPDVSTLSSRESRVWRQAERRLVRRADEVITVCESIAEVLSRRNRIRMPRVLLNCPPLAPLPDADFRNLLRERAGIASDDEPLILYQGAFSRHRGLPELVMAARALERGTLVLMGWGTLEEALRDQVRREGLSERVRIVPPVAPADLALYTAGADIGVIPYMPVGLNNTYTTPNKLFEYVSAGLPIAGSRLPELVRFLEGFRLGVTFDPEDPDDVAARINELVADGALRSEIRARALELRESLSWEAQSEVLLDVYARMGPVSPA